jgi:hypothetical protein
MISDNQLLMLGVCAVLGTTFLFFYLQKRGKSWLIAHVSVLSIYSLFFLYLLLSAVHGEEAFVAWGYWLIVLSVHEILLILGALFSGFVRYFKA